MLFVFVLCYVMFFYVFLFYFIYYRWFVCLYNVAVRYHPSIHRARASQISTLTMRRKRKETSMSALVSEIRVGSVFFFVVLLLLLLLSEE